MLKRQRRRQDEKRVKAKFKKVAEHMLRSVPGVARIRAVEDTAVRMAHHPAHQCQMCHLDEKAEKHTHEFEVKKKAPLITEDE